MIPTSKFVNIILPLFLICTASAIFYTFYFLIIKIVVNHEYFYLWGMAVLLFLMMVFSQWVYRNKNG